MHNTKQPLAFRIFFRLISMFEYFLLKHSTVGAPSFFDNRLFPWVNELEQKIDVMQQEMQMVLKRVNDLPSFQEISPEQMVLTSDEKWKIFPFFAYGVGAPELEQQCPNTMALLKKIPGIKTAMYSILSPHKHIPPHRGPYRGLLRLHIPLQVPVHYRDCKIQVDKEVRCWEPNKCLIFDDGFMHQVWNDTDDTRVVIFIDFLRPLNPRWDRINKGVVNLFSKTSFIKKASDNALKWYKEKWI